MSFGVNGDAQYIVLPSTADERVDHIKLYEGTFETIEFFDKYFSPQRSARCALELSNITGSVIQTYKTLPGIYIV